MSIPHLRGSCTLGENEPALGHCQAGTEVENPWPWASAQNAIPYTALPPSGQGQASVLGRQGGLTGRPQGLETSAQGDISSRIVGAAVLTGAPAVAANSGTTRARWAVQLSGDVR